MVEARYYCGQCGQELPRDAPAGLCPECLLRLGMQSQSQPSADPNSEGIPATATYGHAADAAVNDSREGPLDLTPRQQFGGYRVVRRLGSGGMGTVYEADHVESGRRVALKVLAHRLDSPESKQRFLREGRLAASVNHPNSVYVFGTEEIAGVPVIAMELVPGGTLEQRGAPRGTVARWRSSRCDPPGDRRPGGCGGRGVLHRDVKPANCFVDRDGTIKVGDFGLSISTSLRGDSNVTSDGTFLGTPAFSSPEQLRGDELDIRSDIYAVGVTLYYLLTGRMPFKADNLVRLIATVLEHPPTSPDQLRPDIPKGLVRTVMRCLQKQPAARYGTYDELRQVLAPFSSAAPTPAALGLRLGAGILDYVLLSPVVTWLMLFSSGEFERMSSPDYYGSPDHVLRAAPHGPDDDPLLRHSRGSLGRFSGQGDLRGPGGESTAERRGIALGTRPRPGLCVAPPDAFSGVHRSDRDRCHRPAAHVVVTRDLLFLVRHARRDVFDGTTRERIRRVSGSGKRHARGIEVGRSHPACAAGRWRFAAATRCGADCWALPRACQPADRRRCGDAAGLRPASAAASLDSSTARWPTGCSCRNTRSRTSRSAALAGGSA